VKDAAQHTSGSFALGLPPGPARTVVFPLVEAFKAELPEAALRAVDGLSANLVELVMQRKLDCALVYNALPHDKLKITPLHEEPLYLVSGRFNPLAVLGKSVPLSEVARLPIISAGRSNPIHLALVSALARLGSVASIVHEVENLNAMLDLVRRDHGYRYSP